MSFNNEIVAGIDIGTTSALCILDKNLNVLFLKSKREYKISEIIDDILKFGKPLLISCDRKKIPKKILKIAKSLGVKVFHPKEDVREEKKLKVTKNYLYNNWHERDAVFSAIIAMKFLRKKILREKKEKIVENVKIQENKKEKIQKPCQKMVDEDNRISIAKLIDKIKQLKEENKKLKELLEKVRTYREEKVKLKIVEIKDKNLETENKALKIVIQILKMNLEKDEIPYIKIEEINEDLLKIIKNYIEKFAVISNQVEKFYILENLGVEYVITEKNIENIWNLKLIVDDIEKYNEVGKINLEYLKNKWKERLLKILNEKDI